MIETGSLARSIRRIVVQMCLRRGQGYAGQGLGLADVMAELYGRAIRRDADGRDIDRFVLSTGHSAIALFATLGALGRYELDELEGYGTDGSRIEESPLEGTPGFEITGGSLGQGLSQAVGIAIGERMKGRDTTVYCLISDGELQEGQIWEAAMFAGHYGLGNLVVLVDDNRMQADGATADIMTVEPITQKFAAFGFAAVGVDAHDPAALRETIPGGGRVGDRPLAVILRTVPGHGAPTLERYRNVHYIRTDDAVWRAALSEIDAGCD
jgi:transketolase